MQLSASTVLGSEHSRVSSVKLLSAQSSSAGIYSASNKTQRINVWLVFLIAITGILDKGHVSSSLFHFLNSQKLSRVD